MLIVASLAAAKALSVGAGWCKQAKLRRHKTLMGSEWQATRCLPLIDRQLKHSTRNATKVQVFIARKVSEVCRQVVHTHAFEYLLLQVIQSGVRKHGSKSYITKPEVVL